jgi:hypothetical protein
VSSPSSSVPKKVEPVVLTSPEEGQSVGGLPPLCPNLQQECTSYDLHYHTYRTPAVHHFIATANDLFIGLCVISSVRTYRLKGSQLVKLILNPQFQSEKQIISVASMTFREIINSCRNNPKAILVYPASIQPLSQTFRGTMCCSLSSERNNITTCTFFLRLCSDILVFAYCVRVLYKEK